MGTNSPDQEYTGLVYLQPTAPEESQVDQYRAGVGLFSMYGSLFPRHSSNVAVHWLEKTSINILENVWPNNRDIAASIPVISHEVSLTVLDTVRL